MLDVVPWLARQLFSVTCELLALALGSVPRGGSGGELGLSLVSGERSKTHTVSQPSAGATRARLHVVIGRGRDNAEDARDAC